jgi:hypothetical protein
MASEGDGGIGRKGRATRGEGEQEVEAVFCMAATGGGTASAAEQSRGAEGLRGRR